MLKKFMSYLEGGICYRAFTSSFKGVSWVRATVVLFLLAIAIGLSTFASYGISWDEGVHQKNSINVLKWYGSFTVENQVILYGNLYLYGAFVDIIAGIGELIVGYENTYALRRLICWCFGFAALCALTKLCHLISGSARAVFFAALLLLINPVFYGHAFINSKDIPFAALYLWSLYYLARIVGSYPKKHRRELLGLAVCTGLLMGIRVGGLIMYGYFLLALFMLAIKQQRVHRVALKESVVTIKDFLLTVIPLSYVIMVALWPWAQLNPLVNPLKGLMTMSNFPWLGLVAFQGNIYRSDELPWYYIPKLMLFQNTEVLLLGLLFFALFIPVYIRKKAKRGAIALAVFAAFFPIAYVIIKGAIVYDNYRHFLFVIPVICLLSALGIEELLRRIEGRSRLAGRLVQTLLILLFIHPMIQMVRLFPYEYTYYNAIAGGTREAQKDYESDYWATAVYEVMQQLEAEIAKRPPRDKQYFIKSNKPYKPVAYFLRTRSASMVYDESDQDWEFFISTTRGGVHEEIEGEIILRVGRFGNDYAVVKERKKN